MQMENQNMNIDRQDEFFPLTVILLTVFILASVGNIFVIVSLLRRYRSWTVSMSYLFNLAIADLLFACTIPFWVDFYYKGMTWHYGDAMCKVAGTITFLNLYGSVFFLTAMAIDRWMAVVHYLTLEKYRRLSIARWVCVAVWLSAFLLSVPSLLYDSATKRKVANDRVNVSSLANATSVPQLTSTEDATTFVPANASTEINLPEDGEDIFNVCSFPCAPMVPLGNPNRNIILGTYYFLNFIFGFAIPMIVISACYIQVLITVRNRLLNSSARKYSLARLIVFIIVAFFVFQLPEQTVNIYNAFSYWIKGGVPSARFYVYFSTYSVCFTWSRTCVNPIAYIIARKDFRKHVAAIFRCKKSATATQVTVAKTRNNPDVEQAVQTESTI
ncbi:unnamed protein product [Clavelina lepadiformis]|uniref:G-protein coupled receptors family 1 profile domain-containing protein n=1 Tax=Clavelina lepadiformis TaxID=159417 RepID=A0ABP0FS56_CLALP